jgi:aspartate/methionine/tyrosine aminotransferase
MDNEYLTWYKNLEIDLHEREDVCLLLSSAVSEPTELLEEHLRDLLQHDFAAKLAIPDSWGYPPLMDAVAVRYGVDADCVVPTGGVSNAIYFLCRTLVSGQGGIAVETPSYEPLRIVPGIVGRNVTTFERRHPDYSVDLDQLRHAISTETQLVLVSNLHNPSCAMLTDDDLLTIADIARSANPNILIVVDEVYHDFIHHEQRTAALLDDCFISLNSLSKVYGLSSVRVGWIIARPVVTDLLRRMFVVVEGSGSRLRDLVATVIVENMDQFLEKSVELMRENRSILSEIMQPLLNDGIISGAIPAHGCTYFPRIDGVDDTSEFVSEWADRFGVYGLRECLSKFAEAIRAVR